MLFPVTPPARPLPAPASAAPSFMLPATPTGRADVARRAESTPRLATHHHHPATPATAVSENTEPRGATSARSTTTAVATAASRLGSKWTPPVLPAPSTAAKLGLLAYAFRTPIRPASASASKPVVPPTAASATAAAATPADQVDAAPALRSLPTSPASAGSGLKSPWFLHHSRRRRSATSAASRIPNPNPNSVVPAGKGKAMTPLRVSLGGRKSARSAGSVVSTASTVRSRKSVPELRIITPTTSASARRAPDAKPVMAVVATPPPALEDRKRSRRAQRPVDGSGKSSAPPPPPPPLQPHPATPGTKGSVPPPPRAAEPEKPYRPRRPSQLAAARGYSRRLPTSATGNLDVAMLLRTKTRISITRRRSSRRSGHKLAIKRLPSYDRFFMPFRAEKLAAGALALHLTSAKAKINQRRVLDSSPTSSGYMDVDSDDDAEEDDATVVGLVTHALGMASAHAARLASAPAPPPPAPVLSHGQKMANYVASLSSTIDPHASRAFTHAAHARRPAPVQPMRPLPATPVFEIHAPGPMDDYYRNVLDWSPIANTVALAIDKAVHVVDATSFRAGAELRSWTPVVLDDDDTIAGPAPTSIASVRWCPHFADRLAVGTSRATVEVWRGDQRTHAVAVGSNPNARVAAVAWRGAGVPDSLAAGTAAGTLALIDLRADRGSRAYHTWPAAHAHEICGLAWDAAGTRLASGGNDDAVRVWDVRWLAGPLAIIAPGRHTAAVKALAWCPWDADVLATGAGTVDRHLRTWRVNGTASDPQLLAAVDTGAQVTSVRWHAACREIVSSHGYPHPSVAFYDAADPRALALKGTIDHPWPTDETGTIAGDGPLRILHSAVSPDDQQPQP
ncbi:ubiquitin-protein transferase activating protein [Blastocladiella emersonii ATCC 22665]|nr:ubiquitin-protein transferase activating protein [Blastocladiella emersonii ATCC 22665]